MNMTLKEKVMQMQPGCVDDIYAGGVRGCPANYSYLNKPKLEVHICDIKNGCGCCWNQPFEKQEPIIKEKIHTKSITWARLWRRIGKQPIRKTQNKKVEILIDGELKECALVFTDNGSKFHLEIAE